MQAAPGAQVQPQVPFGRQQPKGACGMQPGHSDGTHTPPSPELASAPDVPPVLPLASTVPAGVQRPSEARKPGSQRAEQSPSSQTRCEFSTGSLGHGVQSERPQPTSGNGRVHSPLQSFCPLGHAAVPSVAVPPLPAPPLAPERPPDPELAPPFGVASGPSPGVSPPSLSEVDEHASASAKHDDTAQWPHEDTRSHDRTEP
jgi:hypothetical protein